MDKDIINAFCAANLERQRKLFRAEFNAIGLKYNLVPKPIYTMEQGHAIEGTIDFIMLIEKYYKIVAPFENDLRALYYHFKDTDVEKKTAFWANRICKKYHDINQTQANKIQVATLPDWAQTTEGAQILNKLVVAGYCSRVGQLYRWNKAKRLWAYFADEISDALKLRGSNDNIPFEIVAEAFDNVDYCKYASQQVSKYTDNNKHTSHNEKPKGWERLTEVIYKD